MQLGENTSYVIKNAPILMLDVSLNALIPVLFCHLKRKLISLLPRGLQVHLRVLIVDERNGNEGRGLHGEAALASEWPDILSI